MPKLNFQQPLLQFSVSHDPEIILIYWIGGLEIQFLLLSMFQTIVLLNIFVETMIYIYIFFFFSDEQSW